MLTTSNLAAEPHTFVAISLDNAAPGNRAIRLHQAVTIAAGIESTIQPLRGKRAVNAFYRGAAIAMQDRKCDIDEKIPVLRSRPYATVIQYLISNEGATPINSVDQLRGKSIAFAGFQDYRLPSDHILEQVGVDIHYARNHTNAIRMLLNKRVDAILASPKLLNIEAPALFQSGKFSFDQSKPFYRNEICYIVQDNDKGRLLVEKLNKGIANLEKSGGLKKVSYLSPAMKPRLPPGHSLKPSLIQDLEAFEAKLAAH